MVSELNPSIPPASSPITPEAATASNPIQSAIQIIGPKEEETKAGEATSTASAGLAKKAEQIQITNTSTTTIGAVSPPLPTTTTRPMHPKALSAEVREAYINDLCDFATATELPFAKIYELINAPDRKRAFAEYRDRVGEEEIKEKEYDERLGAYESYQESFHELSKKLKKQTEKFFQTLSPNSPIVLQKFIDHEVEHRGQKDFMLDFFRIHDRKWDERMFQDVVALQLALNELHKIYIEDNHYSKIKQASLSSVLVNYKEFLIEKPKSIDAMFEKLVASSDKLTAMWSPFTADLAAQFISQMGLDPLMPPPVFPDSQKGLFELLNWISELENNSLWRTFLCGSQFYQVAGDTPIRCERTLLFLNNEKLPIIGEGNPTNNAKDATLTVYVLFIAIVNQIMLVKDKLDKDVIRSLHREHLDGVLHALVELPDQVSESDRKMLGKKSRKEYFDCFVKRFNQLNKEQQAEDLVYLSEKISAFPSEDQKILQPLYADLEKLCKAI